MNYSKLATVVFFIATVAFYAGYSYQSDTIGVGDNSIYYKVQTYWGHKCTRHVEWPKDEVKKIVVKKSRRTAITKGGAISSYTVFILQMNLTQEIVDLLHPSFKKKGDAEVLKNHIQDALQNDSPYEYSSLRNRVLATGGHVAFVLFFLCITGILPKFVLKCQELERQRLQKKNE
jgi:hypothetical protein